MNASLRCDVLKIDLLCANLCDLDWGLCGILDKYTQIKSLWLFEWLQEFTWVYIDV